jgi:hypothetical protein
MFKIYPYHIPVQKKDVIAYLVNLSELSLLLQFY